MEEPIEDETLVQTLDRYEAEERHHRQQWNHQYGFEGVDASPAKTRIDRWTRQYIRMKDTIVSRDRDPVP